MSYGNDPFSEVEDALWHVVEGFGDFADIVSVGNRVKFSGYDASPELDSMMSADCPSVMLIASGMTNDPRRSSDSKFMEQSYDFVVETDDKRMRGDPDYARGINQLKWAMVLAFERAADAYGDTLPGCSPFVKQVRLQGSPEQVAENSEKTHVGWVSLMRVTLLMHFARMEVVK